MGRTSQKTVDRIEAAEEVRSRIEAIVCASCEDVCWHIEVWCHGTINGEDYRSCVLYRDHLPAHKAFSALGRFLCGVGTVMQDRAAARWLLEHEPTLW